MNSVARSNPADRATASWLGLRPGTLLALVAIPVLLLPIWALGQPADSTGPGGTLARLRARSGLAQANLGEIDPTSETMRLATLGLNPVAVTLLWDRVNHYKKVEDWTSLSAALEQMTKLQPYFFSVWDFQAHNLSYNISVEFDDYHDRYAWVMKGIEFLRQGVALNRLDPRLLGRMGWFIGQKIGKSDEKVQYRRLFKADDDFHERDDPERTLPERDNWLVARGKYRAAQALADGGAALKTTPLIFHSEPMMTAINYARALEEEGVFGSTAAAAWKLAGEEVARYAMREIPTSWNVPIRLGLREDELARASRLEAELEALLPGRRAEIRAAKVATLPAEQRTALETAEDKRTDDQRRLAEQAEATVSTPWQEVAREAPAAARDRARELVRQFVEANETAEIIGRYREIVNFDFWRACCEAEVTPEAIVFRERVWEAEREFKNARLQTAKKAYEEAFAAWRKVLDASPLVRADRLMREDTGEIIDRYRRLLDQLDEPFPKPFILQDVLE